jgi:hypothetical protein
VLGGVAVGSRFKDPTSSWHSNVIGLWSPVETASFGGQLYLAYNQLANMKLVNGTNATKNSNSTNSTTVKSTTKRVLMDI